MKNAHRILAVMIAGIAAGAYWASGEQTVSSTDQAKAATNGNTATIAQRTNIAANGTAGARASINVGANDPMANQLNSPFATGSSITGSDNDLSGKLPTPDAEIVPPEEAARRKKMEALGYMVPPEYYQKDVRTLRQLAKSGDAFAMVHLGEKYYFELNGSKQNPDFESGIDYPSAARQSFSEALAAGNIRSAAIIAETYLQENNAVDAYAWHILSEQLGDSISADWFKRTKAYTNITEQDKKIALDKVPALINQLNALSQKMNRKPVFQS